MAQSGDRFDWAAGAASTTEDIGDALRRLEIELRKYSPTREYMSATLSGAQSSNIAATDHVEFDTVIQSSDGVELSTGSGQANGIFTLSPGVYHLSVSSLIATFSGVTGVLEVQFTDGDDNLLGAGPARLVPPGSSSLVTGNGSAGAIFVSTPELNQVRLTIESVTALTSIAGTTGVTIIEL